MYTVGTSLWITKSAHEPLDNRPLQLQYALENAGFETTTATRGSLALTMLSKQCFDVLIVDVNLPHIDGIALAEQARERYQDRIAILVTSDQDIERWGVASL
ncbi:MAG: response regulator [Chloroflexota bacterium]|nr:response regulator [Chloroflexota bacterium]